MTKHIQIVAILQAFWGAWQLAMAGLIGLIFVVLGGSLGAFGASSGEEELMAIGGIYGVLGLVTGVVAGVMAIPALIAGYGLHKRKGWGRILAMVVAGFAAFSFPLGTLFCVYCFYVLLDSEVSAEFGRS